MAMADSGASIGGVTLVLGIKKGGGSETQSVVFAKDKWTLVQAKAWLVKWDMKADQMRETSDSYRFRQRNPLLYKSFRVQVVANVHHVGGD